MSATSNLFVKPLSETTSNRKNTPLSLLVSLACFIFLSEMIAMIILYYVQVPNYVLNTLLDGMIMLVLIFPGLYILQLRPIIRKIKEQEQTEIALRTSQALLERFFNSIHTMIAYLDPDFNIIRVNKAYAEGGGHPLEFYSGKNHFILYPHAENEAIFRRVVETGERYIVFEKPFEYAEFPERGVTYWDWSLEPVLGQDSRVEGLVLSLVDVTRRKQAELQLERQNQELHQLTETEHRQRVLAEGLVQSVITLNTSLELDQVLISVLEQTRKATSFQGAVILLVEDDTWRVAAALGFEDYPEVCLDMKTWHTFDGYPLLDQVRSSLQMQIIDSVIDHPGWCSDLTMDWVCSYATIPLINNSSVIGILELYDERYAAFGKGTAGRLVAFTAPAALAINNARLYQAEMEAHQIAETMRGAAQILSKTLDLEEVIHTLLDHIQMIVSSDTLGFTLMEGEERWTLRASRGYNAWADRMDIPTVPLEKINEILDIQNPDNVFILERKAFDSKPENADPGSIQRWAILPLIINEKMIGFVELGKAGKELFRPEQMQWAEALIMEASVAIQNAWLFEQARSSSLRLQSLAHKLVALQEKERHHIARELHDEAGQVLSSLKLSLAQTEQNPDCPDHIRQRLLDLMKVTDVVLEDLHRLAMDLRPVALDHLGLVPALSQLANGANTGDLTVKFKALGFEGDRLPADIETSIYRIVQEALANILRHAHACNVGILLEWNKDKLKLFVEDDGIGFNSHDKKNTDQLGLVGMRERAEMLGGNLTIESSPGVGTSIIVEVPDGNADSHHG